MAKHVVIEELHVTLRVPDDLSDKLVDQARESLDSRLFRSRLSRAVRQVMAGFPALTGVRVQITR